MPLFHIVAIRTQEVEIKISAANHDEAWELACEADDDDWWALSSEIKDSIDISLIDGDGDD